MPSATFAPPETPVHGGDIRRLAAAAGRRPEEVLDFSASINPLGPPEYLRPLLSRHLSSLLHYPDPEAGGLRAAAAARFGLAPEQVLAANGSTELIHLLPRAVAIREAVIPAPAYLGYQEALVAAGVKARFPALAEERGFALDWAALAASLTGGEMVFLGQPGNPTGRSFNPPDLAPLLAGFPDTTFVVDEAFIDFVESAPTVLPLLARFSNLVILRSLTKFYAVPGLRLGLAFAAPELAARIRALQPPWSVNSLALALGERVLGDEEFARRTRACVAGLRKELAAGLAGIEGLFVYPGEANYLLCRWQRRPRGMTSGAAVARALLAKEGIAIRLAGNFTGLSDDYFRVAVRPQAENERLIAALARLVGRQDGLKPSRKTPALMLAGTSSDAGKSVLTAALCRILLQDGLRVAPFKAQNMSLNSFVTREGGEMGRAQVVQAQACRLDPETRMNPVLLKPVSQTGSQVIVNGRSRGVMSVAEYIAYKPQAFAQAQAAYDSLAGDFEAVILEGAGSPAEINLKAHDIVNLRMARHAGARVLLVGDIDRGGVFASFVGTLEVLTEWERDLVAGLVINRFRGSEALLAPACEQVLAHTGRPVLGVIPDLPGHGLPEEDSVSFKKGLFDRAGRPACSEAEAVEIALIDLPHISNFTDFEPLLAEPDVHLRVVREARDLGQPAAVILPGSRNVIDDLCHLRQSGLAEMIGQLAQAGKTEIVGLCGGFQMLGEEIGDPHGLEAGGRIAGLGLLPVTTVLLPNKTLTRRELTHLPSGQPVLGYEIHHGQTKARESLAELHGGPGGAGVGLGRGRVWGTYLHGLFDSDPFRGWFIDSLRRRRGLSPLAGPRPAYDLEPALDRLAALVRERLDMRAVYRLLGW